jgi:uncharacterized protein (TIGR03067 family)
MSAFEVEPTPRGQVCGTIDRLLESLLPERCAVVRSGGLMKHLAFVAMLLTLTAGTLAQAAKPADPTAAALASLQGKWVVTTINGQSVGEGGMEMLLTFTGDKYTLTMNGAVNERGTIKLDASKKPVTIDLSITEGDDAGKTQLGVIDVSVDKLTANLEAPGSGQRPTDFSPREGLALFLATRAK